MTESTGHAVSDAVLYQRGIATLIASWEAYAAAAPSAALRRGSGVTAAIFPQGPERAIYNNALLARRLSAAGRSAALDAMATLYRDADVVLYAAWVHESDAVMCEDLERRGYTIDSSTRAMGMNLGDLHQSRPDLPVETLSWDKYVGRFGLPDGLLADMDATPFHLRVARLDGDISVAALAFDHDGDCGIYNVETLEYARRRGLGTALTLLQLHEARTRGCQTASLQATPMAERVYASLGFRDLGRILEYIPNARG